MVAESEWTTPSLSVPIHLHLGCTWANQQGVHHIKKRVGDSSHLCVSPNSSRSRDSHDDDRHDRDRDDRYDRHRGVYTLVWSLWFAIAVCVLSHGSLHGGGWGHCSW